MIQYGSSKEAVQRETHCVPSLPVLVGEIQIKLLLGDARRLLDQELFVFVRQMPC